MLPGGLFVCAASIQSFSSRRKGCPSSSLRFLERQGGDFQSEVREKRSHDSEGKWPWQVRLHDLVNWGRSKHKADVAQLVEQPIRNRQVSGSTPLVGSNISPILH
jgi:hypothetical protein